MTANPSLGETLDRLTKLVEARRADSPEKSYTAKLLQAGVAKCAQKVGEEAVEVAIAAVGGTPAHITAEAADLLYHLTVLLAASGVSADDVAAELARRSGTSGLDEKASRTE